MDQGVRVLSLPGDGANAGAAAAALAAARGHAHAGRIEEALHAARVAAEMEPRLGEAFAIWGVSACELGRFSEAVEPLRIAVQRVPPGTIGWANLASQLARALSNTGFWAEAVAHAEAVERLDPPDPLVRQRIGAAFARMNLSDRGLPHLEWARRERPDWPDLLTELGIAYLAEGRLDEAEAAIEQAIATAPAMTQPHSVLAGLRQWRPETAHVGRLEALRADSTLSPLARGNLGFALFKELDDLGRTEEAWAVLEESNEACRTLATMDWTEAGEAEFVAAQKAAFPVDRLAEIPRLDGEGAYRPIFIVGLPRSGTTLLERIIAAHSEVEALGELPTFPIIFRAASLAADRTRLDAPVVHGVAGADWRKLGELYLSETAPLGHGGRRFIDKLPANSLLVGAIALALPHASIIHMRRRPMDALFGAYKVRFSNWYGWAYRQADLAAHYLHHAALMDHWRTGLGERFIELDYEDLAAEPESTIRRVLDACNLPFETACLEPHKTAGPVRTASIVQVREPITTSRIAGWRRYERQLEPLRCALEAAGVAVE